MIKYNINEKKGVVVAMIEQCEFDAIHKVMKRYPPLKEIELNDRTDVEDLYERFNLYDLRMPHKFVGVAKCNDEDTFDEEVGVKLAGDRVKEKYNKTLNRLINNWVDKMEKQLRTVLQGK